MGDAAIGPDRHHPLERRFRQRGDEEAGRGLDGNLQPADDRYGQQGYDTALLIGSALKTAGTDDIDALAAAIKEADFDSVRGSFAFGANQHPIQDWYMTEVVADANGDPKMVTKEKIREAVGDVYAAECKM